MQDLFEKMVRIFSENTMLNYIADTCLTVSVVIAFLLLIRPVMKRLPRIGMYILWFMVVIRMLCPVTVNGIYGILPEQVGQSVAEANRHLRVEDIADRIEYSTRIEYTGRENAWRLPVKSEEKAAESSDAVKTPKEDVISGRPSDVEKGIATEKYVFPQWTDAGIILAVWGAGVILCWLYMLVSLLYTKLRYADARHLQDNIYTHPLAEGSFVAGIFSPRIYVPETLSEPGLVYILCHERVHIRRRDYLVKPFVFAVFSILWFNPLIWIAWHFMMKDMEISCDEAVLRSMGSEVKARYSYLLLSMAESERSSLRQNPAFSAGMIRERIVNVMKYKRPTAFVTALVMAVVVLCSCGIASTPKEAEKKAPEQEKKIYVEQTLPCFAREVYGNNTLVEYDLPQMDPEGSLVDLPLIYGAVDNGDYTLGKVKMIDGEWQSEEPSWMAEYEKMFEQEEEKGFILQKYQYAGDGYLYLTVFEYSMSLKKYKSDIEKYEDSFYLRDIHFMKVDEAAGTLTEIEIPKESVEKVLEKQYGKNIPDDCQTKGVATEEICVLGNGNLYITDSGNINGIYSQVTGQKIADSMIERAYCFTGIVPGDDFYCCGIVNFQTKQVEIQVYDEGGELINTLPTGVEASKEKTEAALGVKDHTVLLATAEGIFEADPEDKEFTRMVDAGRGNIYYLSEDYEIESNCLFKGEDGGYYLALYKETTSGGAYDDYYLCYYSVKE